MKTQRTASLVGLAVSVIAYLPSCKKTEPPPPDATASQAPAPSFSDHVGPGELFEGDIKAFGLPMPRGFVAVTHLTYMLSGELPAPPENVANFIRARVGDGKITMGSTSTFFSHVRPRNDPTRTLDIRVEKVRNGTRIDVAEVLGLNEPVPSSQAEALKKAGLQPSGRPDPQMQ